ncbi:MULTISPECIES: ArsR/SmtB family transcription factor [Mumia]|uniref:ArsR/SmtB family transcription factor n=1 Tax=Mumia TaxID=1546255 RepID=UPI00142430E7|nr:helix-turn-helix domain-containing protein [Mumia sp. ZJ1417]QMW66366.1 helix-turn-helix transcriptional regulator [Mumia sp. ZJ1417]
MSDDREHGPDDAAYRRTITDAKALSALANPFRARMLDALSVDGPSTASALAQRTGQAVGSASHHLKVLHEAGLVEEAPELARDRRERWWRKVSPSLRWSRNEFATDTAAVDAAKVAESMELDRQSEAARTWLANSETSGDWDGAAFVAQTWLRLTPAELRELGEEMVDLLTRWHRREVPDDGAEREPILVFSRGFPHQP